MPARIPGLFRPLLPLSLISLIATGTAAGILLAFTAAACRSAEEGQP